MAYLIPDSNLMVPNDWFEQLAGVAEAIGAGNFYIRLLNLFSRLFDYDARMLTLFSRKNAPLDLFLENHSEALSNYYSKEIYPHCPYYNTWCKRTDVTVLTLADALNSVDGEPGKNLYKQVFLSMSGVTDELAIFLPTFGDSGISMFVCRKNSGQFSPAEIDRAKIAYPAFRGLQHAHLARLFSSLGNSNPITNPLLPRPALLVDSNGKRLFANSSWQDYEVRLSELGSLDITRIINVRQIVPLTDRLTLKCEPYEIIGAFPSDGYLLTIHTEERAYPPEDILMVVGRFGKTLTSREQEIVAMVLKGNPPPLIADRLGISRGTVKNHRNHIYAKLDITTERELFLMYLEELRTLA